MRQKNKQSCFLLVLFNFCSGPFIRTELADRSIIRALLTASLSICLFYYYSKQEAMTLSSIMKNARDRERHGTYGRDIHSSITRPHI